MDMQRHTSRWAPALAAVLVLAACGGSDDSSAPVDTVPTVDSTSPPGDELRPPTPVEVVSGGASGQSGAVASVATESAPAADAQVASSEMRIAPWIAEYVVGDGMPALPTDDTGYVFDATAAVTPEQVAAVAAALGVDGEPVRIDDGYGVSWRVGPDDGSAPSVWVYEDGQQSWNYNAAWGSGSVEEACAVSVAADGTETRDCPEPQPPVGVPTAADAEQRATEVVSALGIDPASVTFETYADEWSASVNASDTTDQRAAVRSWYFGFGAEGVLQYAGGSLAVPAPVGPYPLVDLDTAVARLSDGYFGGFGGGIAIAEPALAVESEPAVEPLEESLPDDSGVGSVETLLPEPLPVDPPIDPPVDQEAIVVTLVDVQADLWWAWDADGVAWLLPAHRFIDTDGGWHVVPAVTDEFLIQADPVLDGPIPVEGDGGIGDGAEPLPPESLPPAADETLVIDIEPGTDPEVALSTLEVYVGLSIEEFTAEAKASGFETRVVIQDGEPLAVTMDFSPTRVNVAVEGPRVVAVESIG